MNNNSIIPFARSGRTPRERGGRRVESPCFSQGKKSFFSFVRTGKGKSLKSSLCLHVRLFACVTLREKKSADQKEAEGPRPPFFPEGQEPNRSPAKGKFLSCDGNRSIDRRGEGKQEAKSKFPCRLASNCHHCRLVSLPSVFCTPVNPPSNFPPSSSFCSPPPSFFLSIHLPHSIIVMTIPFLCSQLDRGEEDQETEEEETIQPDTQT